MAKIPSLRRFSRGDRVYVQAQRVWLILTCWVMRNKRGVGDLTFTYGDLAEAMGMDRRAGITLNRALGIVGDLCVLNDLPALNTIVVNEATGVPGDHVVTRPGRSYRQEQRAVFQEDWHTIRPPSTGTLRKVWES